MNKALNSDRKFEDHLRPLRLAKYEMLQAALVAGGGTGDEYSILKPACFSDRQEIECRKSEWVDFYLDAIANNMNLTTLPDINSCDSLKLGVIAPNA